MSVSQEKAARMLVMPLMLGDTALMNQSEFGELRNQIAATGFFEKSWGRTTHHPQVLP